MPVAVDAILPHDHNVVMRTGVREPERNVVSAISWIALDAKKVRVRAGAHRSKNKTGAVDTIDEQPIGLDMALSMSAIVADKLMVPHRFRERFACTEALQRFLKLAHVSPAFLCKLVVLLELGCVFKPICHG